MKCHIGEPKPLDYGEGGAIVRPSDSQVASVFDKTEIPFHFIQTQDRHKICVSFNLISDVNILIV